MKEDGEWGMEGRREESNGGEEEGRRMCREKR